MSSTGTKPMKSYDSFPGKYAQLSPAVEAKFDQLKEEITTRIDQEISDSTNAREFIGQKYIELCEKIEVLSDLDKTVSSFRSDIKAMERQLLMLQTRIDGLESKVLSKERPSVTSALFGATGS
ncbi:hypothetical protein JYU34_019538 [Plutella xylostella]|uniref:Uncharacterized protein n=2 Tax=Plutella xylostella TaxID=51655 RepID=A0ABQ7PYF9_PLUXY|nr:hypothetical protein JYU34_019538 [Plutella xylostella]